MIFNDDSMLATTEDLREGLLHGGMGQVFVLFTLDQSILATINLCLRVEETV